jgi:hypothetical protein
VLDRAVDVRLGYALFVRVAGNTRSIRRTDESLSALPIGAQSLNKSNQNSYFFGTKNGPYPLGSIITDAKKWMAL